MGIRQRATVPQQDGTKAVPVDIQTINNTAVGAANPLPVAPTDNESAGVGATAAAPGAGAAVATLVSGSLPAGLYDIQVYVGLSGTLAAADNANMEFREGASVVSRLAVPGAAGHFGPFELRRRLDGSTALSVNAVGASTASSVYYANILAVRVAA
jgi:hypothetical protein